MYQFSAKSEEKQAQRLKNVDLRLVVGYLKCVIRFIIANPAGPRPFIVEGYRSNEEQAKRYAQGRTAPGEIITYAEPGESQHNASPSRALDIGFIDDNGAQDFNPRHYAQFYSFWLEHSTAIVWGGKFKKLVDRPHFEVLPLI